MVGSTNDVMSIKQVILAWQLIRSAQGLLGHIKAMQFTTCIHCITKLALFAG